MTLSTTGDLVRHAAAYMDLLRQAADAGFSSALDEAART
jgi:hypothetical protein